MKKLQSSIAIAFLCLSARDAASYEMPTHYDLSRLAVTRSSLGAPDKLLLKELGLRRLDRKFATTDGSDSPDFTDDCKHGQDFSIELLAACGAEFEDHPGTRSLNHFYDPLYEEPLEVFGIEAGQKSPDWAVNGDGNEFSYRKAREAFHAALTTVGAQQVRDKEWGRVFQSLGQVIHHLQDMAQPQHVRHDAHLDLPVPFFHNPSLYEKYTRELRSSLESVMAGSGSTPIYDATNLGSFRVPKDFWKNTGFTGIAEIINTNFVSAGTNFEFNEEQQVSVTKYPDPEPSSLEETIDVRSLSGISQAVLDFCSGEEDPPCTMSFYSTNEGISNPRASTASIFDQDLGLRKIRYGRPQDQHTQPIFYDVDRVFALNRFNLDAAHPLLLPRAVSYSAGLINYFFRGKLEISLPNEGAYSVADHARSEVSDPISGGFSKIKLKIRNLTPGPNGSIEPMQAPGKLVAVVKFHRNNCYQADLSGEYGSPGVAWDRNPNNPTEPCRSPDEEIVVSDEVTVPAGINDDPQPVTFTFSQNKVPMSGADLYLQVVYRGPLGQEEDAVTVTTKDISEPHYIYNYRLSDQYRWCSGWPVIGGDCDDDTGATFERWCAHGFPTYQACKEAEGLTVKFQYGPDANPIPNYDPATAAIPQGQWADLSEQPLFTPLGVSVAPIGTFTRVALLLDAPPTNITLRVIESIDETHGTGIFQWQTGMPLYTANQLDEEAGTLTPSVQYFLWRGAYLRGTKGPEFTITSPGEVPDMVLVPSQIDF